MLRRLFLPPQGLNCIFTLMQPVLVSPFLERQKKTFTQCSTNIDLVLTSQWHLTLNYNHNLALLNEYTQLTTNLTHTNVKVLTSQFIINPQ